MSLAASRRLLSRRVCKQPSNRSFSNTSRAAADHVRIVEVGPRDGLQNEKTAISPETKIELVRRLARTGIETIEAGSFVHPKWVPQMAASDKVLSSILTSPPSSPRTVTYQWLLPNSKGLDNYLNVFNTSSSTRSGYTRPPPSSSHDSGPASNTSSQDPNAMPSARTGAEAMQTSNGYPTPPPSPSHDSGPASNTSSQDPNAMPSARTGAEAMQTPNGYPTPPRSPGHDSGPASNTSSQDPNAMPSATSGAAAMRSSSPPSAQKHEVSIFMAATETFSKKNTNCTIQESLDRFAPLMQASRAAGHPVRAYISVALGCPFEGPDVDPHRVAELAVNLLEMGADEISVADTTGMGTAPRTQKLLQTLKEAGVSSEDIALHFHDTFGQALINTMVSLEHGIRTFDSAVGGLGGCPYSPGATGNVATEDLVYFLHSLGAKTGVDLEGVSRIGEWITGEIGKANSASAGKATLARLNREENA